MVHPFLQGFFINMDSFLIDLLFLSKHVDVILIEQRCIQQYPLIEYIFLLYPREINEIL